MTYLDIGWMCGGDSLVPRPPPFFVLRLWKLKSAKNGEGLVSFIMCVTSGGCEVGVGGEVQSMLGHTNISQK